MNNQMPSAEDRAESRRACALGVHIGLLLALTAAIAGAALLDYRLAQEFTWLRAECLVAEIAAGTGMVFCLGGAMHYTNRLLAGAGAGRPAWYVRLLLAAQSRGLMLAQFAATALVVAALVVMLFNMAVPGPDYSMLYPGGYTPPPAP